MKLYPLVVLTATTATASAFVTPQASFRNAAFVVRSTAEETSTTTGSSSDFASAVPEQPSVYDRLGFKEEEIAIGIKPEDVLEYLGTRDDLIAKFQRDNKSFTPERAASEVEKFMMDAEMVDAFITYEQRKRSDPGMSLREEAEANLSDPSTWATYAAWIGGGAGFAAFKNLVIEPKYASGEWTDFHIQLPTPDMFMHTPVAEKAIFAADAASHAVDPTAVQSTVEGVAGAVSDALTRCVGESCP